MLHLRGSGVSLVADVSGPALPRILHWGCDLGPMDERELQALVLASTPAVANSSMRRPVALSLIPTELEGWSGTPGIGGHRSGADHVPSLALVEPVATRLDADGGGTMSAVATGGGLRTRITVRMDDHGVVTVSGEVRNDGEGHYDLDGLMPLMPLPSRATDVLDLTGRWCGERSPQRTPLGHGTHLRAGRRGRPGHDSPLLLMCGTSGFGFDSGQVWGVHAAWSGNTRHLLERLPEGAGPHAAVLGAGELLAPGEIRLAPGATYTWPEAVFVYSDTGMDGLSDRLHACLRARPSHPRSPRPLVLNTWEAVYFDHDLDRLTALADVAASIGVERFVLDDGWFGTRRDASTGLGDWYVSDQVWPDGLAPLFDHVRALGMQVGLWVEPEMANPDSDLVRAHPDWLLTPDAPPWRNQQVLDLARPEVSAHLLERLDSLVTEYRLDFLKWDHNRDLHAAIHRTASGAGGPGVHGQTLALYALLADLRSRHPNLEIESCASGGARVDLGIAAHTDRFWTSDTNDAIDRQSVQRWTSLLLPYELMGAHVGPDRTHTTHRRLDLGFRCATALFGHAGLEWDLTTCTEQELTTLRHWAALYKRVRGLLHSGRLVRAEVVDESALLHGVVAHDGASALFCFAQIGSSPDPNPGRVRLPGLDPERRYAVRVCDELGPPDVVQLDPPPWTLEPLTLPGSVLGAVGLPLPSIVAGSALLLELTAQDQRRASP